MYIILVLGNNYIRGDKMKNRRIKSFFVPVIYGTLVLAFLFSMFFVGKFANNLLFSKKDNNIKYVDGEITEGANRDIPVVSTNNTIRVVSPSNSEENADKAGRGMTVPIIWLDEMASKTMGAFLLVTIINHFFNCWNISLD